MLEEPINLEQAEKWEPVEGIITPVARAMVAEDHEGLVVTLVFSEIVNGLQSDLQMSFGRIHAYTVYEEFVHPWEFVGAVPRFAEPWEGYVYPLLQIHNSRWISSIPNLLFVHPNCIHYRFVTLDQIVDVLCNKPPTVNQIRPEGS